MKRTTDPHIARLKTVPVLAACPDHELEQVLALSCDVDVPPGHVLMREADAGREGFIVLEGSAAVDVDGIWVATLGPGQVVGEMALLDRLPRSATVRAESHMKVLVVSALEFATLIDGCPTLRRRILRMVAERLRRAQGLITVQSA